MVCCWLEHTKKDLHGLESVRDPARGWEGGSMVRGTAGPHQPGPSQAGTLPKPRPAPAASVLHAHTAAPAGRLQSKTHQSECICKKESGQKPFPAASSAIVYIWTERAKRNQPETQNKIRTVDKVRTAAAKLKIYQILRFPSKSVQDMRPQSTSEGQGTLCVSH